MKKPTSIKTRITIWYTTLMFVLVLVVLSLVGGLSYQLSIDSVEKDVILQVTQVRESLSKRQPGVFEIVESKEEFKNVSIYEMDGKKYHFGEIYKGLKKGWSITLDKREFSFAGLLFEKIVPYHFDYCFEY